MKHITKEYGEAANKLVLPSADFYILEKFLRELGVRVRVTAAYGETVTIQGENPYKGWISREDRKHADREMTDEAVVLYKR